MNAVEIEEAVSRLVEEPFVREEFPFAFLRAFGQKDAALRKLKQGNTNKSDLPGGVLQRNKNNIHLVGCGPGTVGETLASLRESEATAKFKAKFILATDGETIQAERFADGEPLACDFDELPNRFAFFLPLAGISTVKKIDENTIDIRATGRLNKLYVELLRINPDWDTEARREDLNHFFARLIFCFFAEDTDIFMGSDLFTKTVEQMSERDGSNVHEVLGEVFRAMNIRPKDREAAETRPYADSFPYVNGDLFSGSTETPRFNQSARNYLVFVGNLDWKQINPDIFGSMIQAVADEEERGSLGMHYTSVPNILKVLNPLFLDDLREKLDEAGDGKTPASKGQLKRLRDRIARIRVFDPACGSGNFLVIAYKEMRKIEAEINELRGEAGRVSEIPISNFRGIEIRHFPAEIARLALIIAEFQCDVLYRGELFAKQEFLPLDTANWITCGNALRIDWLSVCPPTGKGVKLTGDDLFNTPKDQAEIDFENAGGETYICGNPPYLGFTWQNAEQKAELQSVCGSRTRLWKSLDYVACWFLKAADYGTQTHTLTAFVTTNSICQGQQVPILWPLITATGHEIFFAYTSFNWANLASHNAGVTVNIVGMSKSPTRPRKLLVSSGDAVEAKEVKNINAYLVPGPNVLVKPVQRTGSDRALMEWGNKPTDGGHLLMTFDDRTKLAAEYPQAERFIFRFMGAQELIQGNLRYCLWISDQGRSEAEAIPPVATRIAGVSKMRRESAAAETRRADKFPHRFRQIQSIAKSHSVVVPGVSSERREYLPVGLEPRNTILGQKNFALYDADLWNFALLASRAHWIWIKTVCVRLRTDPSYSNTLGWNTFPLPTLTDEHKAALTRCAEDILLAREAYFPATIAEMYNPEAMDTKYPDLRAAHDRNDETLERIYIGRRFRNDTERLEKLFEMYTEMTAKADTPKAGKKAAKKKSTKKSTRRA